MISDRKRQHLEICLNNDVEDKSCFEEVILVYNALPDLNFEEIDTSVEFLGKLPKQRFFQNFDPQKFLKWF